MERNQDNHLNLLKDAESERTIDFPYIDLGLGRLLHFHDYEETMITRELCLQSGNRQNLSPSPDNDNRGQDITDLIPLAEPEGTVSQYPVEFWEDILPSISQICVNTGLNRKKSTNFTEMSNELMPPTSIQGNGQETNKRRKRKRRPQTLFQRQAATLRERKRVETLKSAFSKLREKVPTFSYETDLTRLETLKLAVTYIGFLSDVLKGVRPDHVSLRRQGRIFKQSLDN